jgi:kynureninase
MNKESRKKMASLSFSEKIKILEKLRDRSLALADARKRLVEKKRQKESP